MTVQAICSATSLHTQDVVLTLMLLGFLRKSVENRFVLAVDWRRVGSHVEKVARAARDGTRIDLDPEALRWTPVVSGHDLFRSPYKVGIGGSPLRSPGGGILDQSASEQVSEGGGTPW